MNTLTAATDRVNWNEQGLVAAIAQDAQSREILMMAWMNAEALEKTISTGRAVYWSRSRACLWHKGEESGHHQDVKEIRLDCDEDVIILLVEQHGGIACHTGRTSCFYRRWEDGDWQTVEPVVKNPDDIYNRKKNN
ncbi:MAG: phosphoribosyl-AMP cyclohydrolase [Pseudomonadales bacterium]